MMLPKLIPKEPGIYVVGGTVRDLLMGRQPTDYDIAAAPPCEPLAQRIAQNAGSRVVLLGKPGVTIYRIVAGELTFDVAPFAGETIREDLKRRDFTINAMAWDVAKNNLIDTLNGRKDIEAGQIRMISPENFRSDPLRMLRAFRLGAAFRFSIDSATTTEIRRHAVKIKEAAGERIRDELMKMLATPQSGAYLKEMDSAALLTEIFPELEPLKGCLQNQHHDFDAFEHTMTAYGWIEEILARPENIFVAADRHPQYIMPHPARLKLAMLLHDIGKPECRTEGQKGGIHFYRHESVSAEMARAISRRLKLSKDHSAYTDFIIRNHLKPLHLFIAHQQQKLTKTAIARFFLKTRPFAADLLIHAIADARGKKSVQSPNVFEEFCRQLLDACTYDFEPKTASQPLISGHDLINELHLRPSPLFARLLSSVEEERLAGRLMTRSDALNWIKNLMVS